MMPNGESEGQQITLAMYTEISLVRSTPLRVYAASSAITPKLHPF